MLGLQNPLVVPPACKPLALCPQPATACHRRLSRVIAKSGKEVRGSFRNGSEQNNEPLDWGSSAFPSYLVSLSGRPFPCQEGIASSTTRPGYKTRIKWKREDAIWQQIRREAAADAAAEPLLSSFLYASILAHDSFEKSLAFVLANRLADTTLLPTQLFEIFVDVLSLDDDMRCGALADVEAGIERDPACISMVQVILNSKGFQAIQTHRVAHSLWIRGKRVMALALQSRASEVFAVDIHPGARIGKGILLDHGTGVVIGETAVIGDNCSMLQNVTLGGTGKETGDRHPKIGNNVLIGASATVLGNITIGSGSMIGAGSLVLKPVAPRAMVAGTPAKVVGTVAGVPSKTMEQRWEDKDSNATSSSPPASVAAEAAQAQPWPAAEAVRSWGSGAGEGARSESGMMQAEGHASQQGLAELSMEQARGLAGRSSTRARWWSQAHDADLEEPINAVQVDPNELLAKEQDTSNSEVVQQAPRGEVQAGIKVSSMRKTAAAGQHQHQQQAHGSKEVASDKQTGRSHRPKAPRAWGPVASVRGEGI